MAKTLVILPVYNEGKSIYDLLVRYADVLSSQPAPHRIIVVNDASLDDSDMWIKKSIQDLPNLCIEYVVHPANKGLTGALNTGLSRASDICGDDYLVTMDGDNTHNPFLIRQMWLKMDEGADIVIASRFCDQSRIMGLSRWRTILSMGARLVYQVFWRLPGVREYTCLFRMYRGTFVRELLAERGPEPLQEKGFTCIPEMLRQMSKHTPLVVEVPMILRYSDKVGASNMRVLRTVMQTLRIALKR